MVPVFKKNGNTLIEKQAMNGLKKWADNFDSITVLYPEMNDDNIYKSMAWSSIDDIKDSDKIKVISLPLNYGYFSFISDFFKYRKVLKQQIINHTYSVFSIGGLAGDWGAAASLICIKNNYKYAVWTDRVEHLVVMREATKKRGLKKIYKQYIVPFLMKTYHKFIIQNSQVGLFHGNDCFDEYCTYTKQPFLVHDVHYNNDDQINEQDLRVKMEDALKNDDIKICYSGRISEMKGPIEWLNVLHILKCNDVRFKAQWFGEGDLKQDMLETITKFDLDSHVELMGFVADKNTIKKALQTSDLFLFCHKTPESPRNLIEALKSGCPIIGFESSYSKNLIQKHGGGITVENFDCDTVAEHIISLSKERELLASYMKKAYYDGLLYTDDIVFEHRSNIIKSYLN
jgi:glycosyltransferase involved in cell wall biosynthesis